MSDLRQGGQRILTQKLTRKLGPEGGEGDSRVGIWARLFQADSLFQPEQGGGEPQRGEHQRGGQRGWAASASDKGKRPERGRGFSSENSEEPLEGLGQGRDVEGWGLTSSHLPLATVRTGESRRQEHRPDEVPGGRLVVGQGEG